MPTYLLYGPNTFASTQKRQEIVRRYIDKSGALNCGKIDGQELSIERYQDLILTLPLLATTRLVVLVNSLTDAPKSTKEYIEKSLSDIPAETIVIFHELKSPDRRSSLMKILQKPKQSQYFADWDEVALTGWLQKTAQELGGTLPPDLAKTLVRQIGKNPWLLSQEIKKLVLYSPTISRQSINLLTTSNEQLSIFTVIEALQSKESAFFLRVCDQLLRQGQPVQYIISIIGAGLRQLALVTSMLHEPLPKIATKTHLPFFVVGKIIRQRPWTTQELTKAYQALTNLDASIKLGMIEPEFALDAFAIQTLCPSSLVT